MSAPPQSYAGELVEKIDAIFDAVSTENLDEFNNIVCDCIDKLNRFAKKVRA